MQNTAIRQRVADIFKAKRTNDTTSVLIDWFLIAIILLNVIAVIVSTVAPIQQRFKHPLFIFEVFSVSVFTVEYLLRLWSVVDFQKNSLPNWKTRLKYLFSPMALIDLAAILPFYLSLFIGLDLRFLRIIRLIRVAKLGRYSSAMQILFQVFKEEYKVLVAALFLLLVLMLIASSGIYLIEQHVQPDAFGSIPQAMWWAMATLTTVGYGDVTPITPLGKFFGGTITVISMAMVALPAGILASSFSEQFRKRRDKFRSKVKAFLADGIITSRELKELESLRKTLGMGREDAEQLFSLLNSKRKVPKDHSCPHCGKPLK